MRCFVIILFFLLCALHAKGQEYRFHQYRVEEGLPSDIIKAVTQDSLGFIWIATDDGLVKYDGDQFTTYKSAFRSQYTKGFLHTQDGRLLVFGDLDLIEIQNNVDTVFFKTILKGERSPTDSTIWFPKSIYQDRKGDIWLGEPKSVVRYNGTNLERYDFGEANRSPVFIRSFCFFEDEHGNLFTISYKGKVFRYERGQDRFIELDNIQLPEEVSQVLLYQNKLLIAARNGLFTAQVEETAIKNPLNIFPIRDVSNLLLAPDNTVIVSTNGEDMYRIHFNEGFTWENFHYSFKNINSSYISNEGDIWVASDKGLVLVQKNLFVLADVNSQAHFIEGIAYDSGKGQIYYCNKEELVQLKPTEDDEWERTVIYNDKNNYFQSLFHNEKGLWATSGNNVFLFINEKLHKQWDFSKEGNFVHDLFIDSKDNVWLSQAGSENIKVIRNDLTLERLDVADLANNEINAIREAENGLYAMASQLDGYLFFKPHNANTFTNVSVPIKFEVQGDFSVVDAAIQHDAIWLASTEGLLRCDFKTIHRVEFDQAFSRSSVSSVEILDEENILFSNSYGLFRFNTRTGEFWLFDENSGLPSNTITDHGIFVTKNKNVWIGTSYGIAYARESLIESKATLKPYCVDARVNGKPVRFVNGLYAPYGSFITLRFSPVTFPENKINVQWKFADERKWNIASNRSFSLSNLKDGEHTILVRAKKNTGLGWSEPTSIKIIVATPYWKRAQFISLIILLVVLVAWISYTVTAFIANQRKQYLQNLVQERTKELQKANEELTLRNTELDRFVYSASHDLSAPLKSILGLIRIARLEDPSETHNQYLTMMERSVLKLEEFIQEVVSYSRNIRMPLNYEAFDFKEFAQGLLQDHQYSLNFNKIEFIIEDHCHGPVVSDMTRMKIILNNLISNAIKFHWLTSGRKPFVKISISKTDHNYILTVQDNGKGIAERHLQRIFEMFYRASDDIQGSGLGLYILKESVTKLGGKVEAHSVLEQGTTFTITLPVPEHKPSTVRTDGVVDKVSSEP